MRKQILTAKKICYYKQPLSKIDTKYHQSPAEHHASVIDIDSNAGGNGANNQQHSRSGHFTIERSTLCNVFENKNLEDAASLKSGLQEGLKGDEEDISYRIKAFGSNTYSGPPKKGCIRVVYEVLKNPTTLILLICAAISLGIGMKLYGAEKGWYDGVSIFVAVLIFESFTVITSFWKARELDKLLENDNDIQANVLRDGKRQHISITEVVVGDVIFLRIGDRVPADGLFISGYSLQVVESRVTGVSDIVEVNHDQNQFLISGTDGVCGYARILVTSVGTNTKWGKLRSEINCDSCWKRFLSY